MFHMSRMLTLSLLTGLLGVVVSLTASGLGFEESVGLDLLFRSQNTRQVPSDVIVISLDRESSDHFNLPNRPEKWPRSLHARLVEKLIREGAAVIVFDITFMEPRSAEDDRLFADAVGKARNVVLTGYLEREISFIKDENGNITGEVSIEKLIPPLPLLERSAVALTAFPLHRVPIKVTQYWTFKADAGNLPTLPVVAFQVFTLEVYEEFIRLLEKAGPQHAGKFPRNREELLANKHMERWIEALREVFESEPSLAKGMLDELQDEASVSLGSKKRQLLKSLIGMYRSPGSQYLNFYGPPHTVPTLSYSEVLESDNASTGNKKPFHLAGKAVFIGVSERTQPEQKDNFYTVYSQSNGLDLSGVEIAATAFANLLEDKPVQPLHFPAHLAIVFFWGCLIGVLCQCASPVLAGVSVLGLSAAYLFTARFQFVTHGNWYPLVIPLFLQAPVAFFGSVLWNYLLAHRDRERLRKALIRHLPERIVEQVLKNIPQSHPRIESVYGTCLHTDGEQYTSLAESIDSQRLGQFMNQYYEVMFTQVKQHGGMISDIVGDSMLAVWASTYPDVLLRKQACLAALDIIKAVDHFNRSYCTTMCLPTRIGLHSGNMAIGELGAVDHYEYRPMGDIVNTTSRIENLNKYLNTRMLVSREVLEQLDGFLTRELGLFLFVGKSTPLVIHELISRLEESEERDRILCATFAEALSAYRKQSWDEAIETFCRCTQIREGDGPSLFYMNLCEAYRRNPPMEFTDGVIRLEKK